jgi:hypothetical protein
LRFYRRRRFVRRKRAATIFVEKKKRRCCILTKFFSSSKTTFTTSATERTKEWRHFVTIRIRRNERRLDAEHAIKKGGENTFKACSNGKILFKVEKEEYRKGI